MQNHLLYIAKLTIPEFNLPTVRAVTAIWKEEKNTADLSFYFDKMMTEEELEEASTACAEIIAHCSNAMLEEYYVRWDYPNPLPENWLVYKRIE